MFESLGERLSSTFNQLRGKGRLTEDNIKETLRQVRMSLLEADVALPAVKQFIEDIREKAVGNKVTTSLNPGQALVKIVNDELKSMLGGETAELNLKTEPPAVILMAGLQGSGKTTTTAKLAKLIQQEQKKVMVVSCDVYRPAAITQLQRLASDIDVCFHPSSPDQAPINIVESALVEAKQQFFDVLLIDTAGRLHVDEAMMAEITAIHQQCQPIETLFVVDSMTGQDAANTAKAFNDALPLTGVVLTKVDGDARGGAALSVKTMTGKPIKFIGTSEKMDGLDPFHPERIVSRILGMGDIVSLVEEVERKVDEKQRKKLAKKLSKGKSFTLEDFKNQIGQMKSMGGVAGLLPKLPGIGQLAGAAKDKADDKSMNQVVAIINSMTVDERHMPKLINGSRKKRIAAGSGTTIQDVNRLLKQFTQMQKMMKKFAKPGAMKKFMRGLGGNMGAGLGLPEDF